MGRLGFRSCLWVCACLLLSPLPFSSALSSPLLLSPPTLFLSSSSLSSHPSSLLLGKGCLLKQVLRGSLCDIPGDSDITLILLFPEVGSLYLVCEWMVAFGSEAITFFLINYVII